MWLFSVVPELHGFLAYYYYYYYYYYGYSNPNDILQFMVRAIKLASRRGTEIVKLKHET